MTDEQRLKAIRASLELTASGYAGVDRMGNKVDRREFPDAVPMQENSLLNIPKPKPVNNGNNTTGAI